MVSSDGHNAGAFGDLRRPPLSLPTLRRALLVPHGPLGRLELSDATGSTNSDLAQLAQTSPPEQVPDRTVLVTEHQRSGRGRLSRTWITPQRSALTFSLLVRPPVPQQHWTWLSLLAGVAVVRVLRRQAGVEASLKWPNDVLVPAAASPSHPVGEADYKVAGILGEIVTDAAGEAVAVIGIGVNTTTTEQEVGVPTAISLERAGAATTDRSVLLRALVREFVALEDPWRAAGGDAEASGLAAQARELCGTLGRQVAVARPGQEPLTGQAEGLDSDGRLLVRSGEELVAVAAGDVTTVRPQE